MPLSLDSRKARDTSASRAFSISLEIWAMHAREVRPKGASGNDRPSRQTTALEIIGEELRSADARVEADGSDAGR